MSQRRERRKQQRIQKAVAAARSGAPLASIVAAILLVLACLIPLVLWGNPYPEGMVGYWAWGCAVAAVVFAVTWFDPLHVLTRALDRAHALLERIPPRVFAVAVAILAAVLSALIANYVFSRSATSADEIAQLWHARILLSGRLSLPADPNPEFFAIENVIDSGRWYSQFPIGGPLVLALGATLGTPWLVNPVLCGIAAAAMYQFSRRAFGEQQGRVAALLFSLAPMVLFMAGTWMNHVPVLMLAVVALTALVEWNTAESTRRRVLWAAGVGVSLGAMAAIRPVDAAVMAAVVGVFQLWMIGRNWSRLNELGVQAVAGAIAVAPMFYANAMTTGASLRFGYDVMWGSGHQIGFHADPYGDVHTIGRAFEYAITYVSELNMYVFAWPVPALVLLVIALLAMRTVTRWDAILFALFAAQVAVYSSYGLVGEMLGPRFLYTVLPVVIVLVARAPFLIAERLGPRTARAAAAGLVACILIAWTVPSVSYNVLGLASQARNVRQSIRADVGSAVREANIGKALVFLREPNPNALLRRLWGLGVSRPEAARLVRSRETCSLLAAVAAAESDSSSSAELRRQAIDQAARPVDSPGPSSERVTALCTREREADARLPKASFGSGLLLEPIDRDGHISGDVIFVADLGDRNEILRRRFGDRPWYRVGVRPVAAGKYKTEVVPY
jgi:4-amino-4-deoxy-L-arabinose transferase-like glycosyltransferase